MRLVITVEVTNPLERNIIRLCCTASEYDLPGRGTYRPGNLLPGLLNNLSERAPQTVRRVNISKVCGHVRDHLS
eukprot:XP_001710109.1 Hypothetical protein GL50803_95618 [Giardia lamblia ATCC 50803]